MVIPASSKPIYDYVIQSLNSCTKRPLIVGLSGPQGSGKSTVVESVGHMLRSNALNIVQFSLDDVYLTHGDQTKLFEKEKNPLISRRGLPGTHDLHLCTKILQDLQQQRPTDIPIYDKSAFDGQGYRSSCTKSADPSYDVVLFEGWMVGFEPLSDIQLQNAYERSQKQHELVAKYDLNDIKFINNRLAIYSKEIWSQFDAFVHLEAIDIKDVYKWRTQQEHDLIRSKGRGMTDQQVIEFVNGYMPAYELYNETLRLRHGLHLKLDIQRQIKETAIL